MRGKFIVIEGIDGCGKTTQIEEISRWLPSSGLMRKNSKLVNGKKLSDIFRYRLNQFLGTYIGFKKNIDHEFDKRYFYLR